MKSRSSAIRRTFCAAGQQGQQSHANGRFARLCYYLLPEAQGEQIHKTMGGYGTGLSGSAVLRGQNSDRYERFKSGGYLNGLGWVTMTSEEKFQLHSWI